MKRKPFTVFGQASDHSIDYLFAILYDARATTLERVEKLSTEELHWQYKEGWNTIGALLSHIIAITHYFRIEFVEERRMTDEENNKLLPGLDMGKYIPELITHQPIESYIKDLEESRQMLLNSMKGLTFENFTKRVEDYSEETGCNMAWVLYHLAEDEVHHRGQISLLRKLYKEK